MQVSLWELDEGSPGIGLSNWYVSFAWKNALWVDVWTERVSYAYQSLYHHLENRCVRDAVDAQPVNQR
jgi:hypothetical protein